MCELEKWGTFRVDLCLIEKIKMINQEGIYRTLGSCCGHRKHPETIIVLIRFSGTVIEFNSRIWLSKGKRRGNRYYKKDSEGYYYIPEVAEMIHSLAHI